MGESVNTSVQGNLAAVMEYVPGGSLRAGLRRLQRSSGATQRLRASIALQAARGEPAVHLSASPDTAEKCRLSHTPFFGWLVLLMQAAQSCHGRVNVMKLILPRFPDGSISEPVLILPNLIGTQHI